MIYIPRPRRSLSSVLAGASATGLFLLHLTGRGDLGAGDLARLFAPPPLDIHTDLVLSGVSWRVAALWALRVGLLGAFIWASFGLRVKARQLLGMAAVQLAGLVSFALPLALGSVYVSERVNRPGGVGTAALFVLTLIVHVGLVVVFTGLLARAVFGPSAYVRTGHARLWVLATVSAGLWIFASRSIATVPIGPDEGALAYSLALGVSVAQGLLFVRLLKTQVPSSLGGVHVDHVVLDHP